MAGKTSSNDFLSFSSESESNDFDALIRNALDKQSSSQFSAESSQNSEFSNFTQNTNDENEVGSQPLKRKRVCRTNEEKAILKEEKLRAKLKKKLASDSLKRMKPGTCMEFVTVYVDINLINCKFGDEILRSVVESGSIQNVKKQDIENSIMWTTRVMDAEGVEGDNEDRQVLIIWNAPEFLSYIEDETLDYRIKSLQENLPNKSITIGIFNLKSYLSEQNRREKRKFRASALSDPNENIPKRQSKRFQNFNFSSDEIEEKLVDLQLLYDCPTLIFDTVKDVGATVQQFTKAIAETPYKLEKQKQQVDGLGWLATCDMKDCVRVDKSGNGLSQLWLQQLMQFNNSGLDIAQAILQQYPTPLSLFKAYMKCDSVKKGEELLKDILIRRGIGESVAKRKIGPELSRKLYNFMTSYDPNLPLSQE